MSRSLLLRVALSLFVVVLVWGVPELLLRAFWEPSPGTGEIVGTRRFAEWLEGLSVQGQDPGLLYREDPDQLWRLQPDAAIETRNYHARGAESAPAIRITTNRESYRGPLAQERSANGVRVVCMGDSNFFGYPLDDEQTFPAALQRALRARAPGASFEVLNGGVPGYSVVQGLRWFRERFAQLSPDVVLLSYLNNDAWRQPQTDSDLMQRSAAPLGWLRALRRHSYVVQYVASLQGPPREEDLTPRVPLPEFEASYRAFFAAAAGANARVVILDYRTEDAYTPYSAALQALARERGVEYIAVLDRIVAAQQRDAARTVHRELVRQVRRRWGAENLRANPHLVYYAEMQPEHLNEIGAAVLAEEVADRLVSGR